MINRFFVGEKEIMLPVMQGNKGVVSLILASVGC